MSSVERNQKTSALPHLFFFFFFFFFFSDAIDLTSQALKINIIFRVSKIFAVLIDFYLLLIGAIKTSAIKSDCLLHALAALLALLIKPESG